MKQFLKGLAILGLLTAMVVHFNSCESFSEDDQFAQDNNTECTVGVDCPGNPNRLQILAQNPSFAGNISIPSALSQFNVTGLCDPDEYPNHRIQFRINNLAGGLIQSSQLAGAAFETTCNNGAFNLLVKTPCGIYASNQLLCTGLSQNVSLIIEIIGLDDDGNEYQNPNAALGTKSTSMIPSGF